MGCIFSVLSALLKVSKLIIKIVAKVLTATILFLIKIGLLIPLLMVCTGFGLWVGGVEWMTPGTTEFVLCLVALGVVTLLCLWRSLKKAIKRHNAKYDEKGKRIRK